MKKKRRSRAFKENDQLIDFEAEREKRREKRKQISDKKKGRASKENQISQRRAVKMQRRRLVYSALSLFIVGVIGFSVYNVVSLQKERGEAEAAKAALEKEKARLERQMDQMDTDEYIENEARGQLHMIKPGETVYVLPEEEVTGGSLKESTSGGIQR